MPATLLTLPPELIYEIADYLAPDGVLSFKLTHRLLYQTIPLDAYFRNVTLSHCSRLAIRSYLAKPDPNPSHMRCVLCKSVYPTYLFNSAESPSCIPDRTSSPPNEIVELPQRFCAWHVGRLTRIVQTQPGGQNEWVSRMEEMCMHTSCGAIKSWNECDRSCESCGFRLVRTYTRYLAHEKEECKDYRFLRIGDECHRDSLRVRETWWSHKPTSHTFTVDLPVRFEN